MAFTPKLPIAKDIDDPGGFKLIYTYKDLISQNLKNLVLTNPGERVMMPAFGVGIKKFLFEPNREEICANITARINTQVKRYIPFVEILNIRFKSTEAGLDDVDPNFVGVSIDYKILPLDEITDIDISVSND